VFRGEQRRTGWSACCLARRILAQAPRRRPTRDRTRREPRRGPVDPCGCARRGDPTRKWGRGEGGPAPGRPDPGTAFPHPPPRHGPAQGNLSRHRRDEASPGADAATGRHVCAPARSGPGPNRRPAGSRRSRTHAADAPLCPPRHETPRTVTLQSTVWRPPDGRPGDCRQVCRRPAVGLRNLGHRTSAASFGRPRAPAMGTLRRTPCDPSRAMSAPKVPSHRTGLTWSVLATPTPIMFIMLSQGGMREGFRRTAGSAPLLRVEHPRQNGERHRREAVHRPRVSETVRHAVGSARSELIRSRSPSWHSLRAGVSRRPGTIAEDDRRNRPSRKTGSRKQATGGADGAVSGAKDVALKRACLSRWKSVK
jgi:hypothetical protein